MKKYFYGIAAMILPIILLMTGCSHKPASYQCADTAMGTIISQTIYVTTEEQEAKEVSKQVIDRMKELEQNTLSWRLATSEVYRINESAGRGEGVEMSPLLDNVLDKCKKVYAASEGAFDFTIGSLTRLWNIDAWAGQSVNGLAENSLADHAQSGSGKTESDIPEAEKQKAYTLPTEERISEVLRFVGGDKCRVEGNQITLPEGMQLDLGAVGKGIALDETYKLLKQQDKVTGAVISAGGSILTYGSKPDGSLWNVGIVNPSDTGRTLGILSVPGGFCIATSGDYERYVEVDGVRYHHILDPRTGKPADSGVKSVTILCRIRQEQLDNSGLLSDALSTACFVLGVEEGLKLAEVFDAEVLFVDTEGEIIMSEGMKQYFHLS